MTSLRDIALLARFEVLRAVRTWQAVALFVLCGVASGGATWLFIQVIGMMENSLARQMGVPETRVPGAMLAELTRSEDFRSMLEAMAGTPELARALADVPVLAVFHLWFSFLLIPFFAASASAESVAIDVQSRALRFEALRTGRLEIALGRFLGQLVLTGGAAVVAALAVWSVGMVSMRGNEPLALATWLGWLGLRAWCFAIPFVGLGLAASQVTASPAWARVMAVGGVAATWLGWALARTVESSGYLQRWEPLAYLALQLLPQGWIGVMWQEDGWWAATLVCAALGPVVVLTGYARFARRDL